MSSIRRTEGRACRLRRRQQASSAFFSAFAPARPPRRRRASHGPTGRGSSVDFCLGPHAGGSPMHCVKISAVARSPMVARMPRWKRSFSALGSTNRTCVLPLEAHGNSPIGRSTGDARSESTRSRWTTPDIHTRWPRSRIRHPSSGSAARSQRWRRLRWPSLGHGPGRRTPSRLPGGWEPIWPNGASQLSAASRGE